MTKLMNRPALCDILRYFPCIATGVSVVRENWLGVGQLVFFNAYLILDDQADIVRDRGNTCI